MNENISELDTSPDLVTEPAATPETAARQPMHQARPNGRRGGLYRVPDPRYKSPFLAAFLSLIPGLGQVYVGYYNRGFVNPVVVGGILSILIVAGDSPSPPFFFPLAVIFLIFFWLYNIIDAWRRATMYNLALEGVESISLPDDMSAPSLGGSTFGGVVLALAGLVILLHTRFGLPVEVLEQWWPVAPIAFGGYLIYRDRMDRTGR